MKLKCERPSNLDLTSEVEADVRALRSDEKIREVIKTAGLFLGLALVSVLIPVFHFILVPMFLLIAVIFGFKAGQRRERLTQETRVTCLNCASLIILKPVSFAWPLEFRCSACAEPHRLKPF